MKKILVLFMLVVLCSVGCKQLVEESVKLPINTEENVTNTETGEEKLWGYTHIYGLNTEAEDDESYIIEARHVQGNRVFATDSDSGIFENGNTGTMVEISDDPKTGN